MILGLVDDPEPFSPEAFPGKVFDPKAEDDDGVLAWLDGGGRAASQTNHFVELTVRELRRRNVTWEKIGSALGVSKQAVQKKYSELDR
jgi:hypothetical protein